MVPTTPPGSRSGPATPVVVSPALDPDPRADELADSIFLSPRVVDRRAFNELSLELRSLVEQSVAERKAALAALDQLAAASKSLQERESAQHANQALIAKAVKAADTRIAKVQGLVEEAHRAASAADTLGVKADRIIETKVAALEARIEAAQAAAAARVEALEQRIGATARELEQRLDAIRRDADGLLGLSQSALGEQLTRAEALLGCPVSRLGPNAEFAPGSLGDSIRKASDIGAQADAALNRLADVQNIAQSSRQAMSGLLDELAHVMGRVDAQREVLAVEAARIREACKQSTAVADDRLRLVQRAANDAVESVQPRLDALVDRAREHLEAFTHASGHRLDAATSSGLQQLAETRALLTDIVDRAHAAHEPLREMVAKADDAQNSAALTLRLLERSSHRVDAALAALEPWKGLLAGEADTPPQIRQLVEGVRRELRSELGTLTSALRSALAGAERASGSLDTPLDASPSNALAAVPQATGDTEAPALTRLPAGLATRVPTPTPVEAMFDRPPQ